MSNPSAAILTAGSTSRSHGSLPYRRCASSKPATVPGTPTAMWLLWWIVAEYSPFSSRNISACAASGAFSRKSIAVARPSGKRMTMNPPPPMFPACGYVTASAKPVAIAASTAFPPWRRTSAPIRPAVPLAEATIPRGARTTADTVASGGESGAGRTEGGAPGPAAGRAQAAASAATATTTAVARRNETVRLRSVNTCVIPTSARVGDLGDRGIYHGASGPNSGAPPLLPSLHAPSPPPRGCIRHRTCFKPERAFVADPGPARAGGSPLERPPPVALAGDDAVSEASALAVQGPSQPFPVLGRQDFEPEPPDPERDHLEPDQPPGPGFQPREVHEHEIAPELVVPGDPL